jgi:hypothetical protein
MAAIGAKNINIIPFNNYPSMVLHLRKPILDLYERFLNVSTSWGKENAFNRWALKQPWRAVMPTSFFEILGCHGLSW